MIGSSASRRSRLWILIAATLISLGAAEVALRRFSPKLATLRQLVETTGDERGFAPKLSTTIEFEGVFEPLSRLVV